MAMVKAGCISSFIISKLIEGIEGVGKEEEITPYRLPIVSTGMLNHCTKAVINIIATNEPGIFLLIRGHKVMIKIVAMVMATAYQLTLPI